MKGNPDTNDSISNSILFDNFYSMFLDKTQVGVVFQDQFKKPVLRDKSIVILSGLRIDNLLSLRAWFLFYLKFVGVIFDA
mgnify:CR=1 FL=1